MSVLLPHELRVAFPAAYGDTVETDYVFGRTRYLWCSFHDGGKGAYVLAAVPGQERRKGFGESAEEVVAAAAEAAFERRCIACKNNLSSLYSCAQPTLQQCIEHVENLDAEKRIMPTVVHVSMPCPCMIACTLTDSLVKVPVPPSTVGGRLPPNPVF